MLKHTDSVDSTYRLRKNPLNIRNHDGTDFILSKVDRLGQMAENRSRPQQVYPAPRPTSSYQLRDDVYDDSDSDSISEETAFSITPGSRNSKVVQEQLQNIRQRPLSYPNMAAAPLEPKLNFPQKPTHSRGSGSHESLSAILSKEISEDRQQLQRDGGVDLLALSIPTGQPPRPKQQQIDLGPPKLVAAMAPPFKQQTRDIPPRSEINFDTGATPPVPRKNSNRQSFHLELSLASPDLSSLMSEFSSLSFNQPTPSTTTQLGRKNTITSPNVRTSPSKAGAVVFERMRSLRKSQSKEVMSRSRLEKKPSNRPVVPEFKKPEFKKPAPKPIPAHAEIIEIASTPKLPENEPVEPENAYPRYRSLDPDAPRQEALEQSRLKEDQARAAKAAAKASAAAAEVAAEAESKRIAEMRAELARQQEEQLAAAIEQSRLEQERLEAEQEAAHMRQGPGSPVTSVHSFDSHMVSQLCAIPSPIMNAISFTPPLGATVEEEEEEMSEIESIFSGEEDSKIEETDVSGEEAEVESIESDTEATVSKLQKFSVQLSFY